VTGTEGSGRQAVSKAAVRNPDTTTPGKLEIRIVGIVHLLVSTALACAQRTRAGGDEGKVPRGRDQQAAPAPFFLDEVARPDALPHG
jgi:hypothetical protein